MKYSEAEIYAEAMVFARRAVKDGIKDARARQQTQRAGFYHHYMQGADPTAKLAAAALEPIPYIRCSCNNHTFIVQQPELWLKVIKQAMGLFKQRFGQEAYTTIDHRFLKCWDVSKIVARDGVAKRTYQTRRTNFLHGLLVLAAQNGLVYIDKTEDPF